ncbi:hypothetical protein SDC9_153835 [bioreactor metagenome]|uniref:Uncharacterized protein n=1 Tax=bioreactor metagenome TaxID=1076179 RepID=A0A645EZG7_9ZZZZ
MPAPTLTSKLSLPASTSISFPAVIKVPPRMAVVVLLKISILTSPATPAELPPPKATASSQRLSRLLAVTPILCADLMEAAETISAETDLKNKIETMVAPTPALPPERASAPAQFTMCVSSSASTITSLSALTTVLVGSPEPSSE